MHFAFAYSLDGSSFGLSCWIDSRAIDVRPFDNVVAEYLNLQPHMLTMSFACDSLPPGERENLQLKSSWKRGEGGEHCGWNK